ncbi:MULTISPECIES: hypothetical protein [Streptomyces]|uniref:Glycine zipper family protein n=1 Tax=Streptomyces dengpaensis TaxID=2049881 RepID=A0ABN5HYE7_9ACTN|nr:MULTISPECIES: hypothetical protein [Streptomyces]AVH54652.1 hypothetical protein C4B68_01105 [Streptomyces dengpaensis]PIB05177.1 hypothetical protein B1C81_30100 [Streptomyces sp. HG99]
MGTYGEDLKERGQQLRQCVRDREFMEAAETTLDTAKELGYGAAGLVAEVVAVASGALVGAATGTIAGAVIAGPVGGTVGSIGGGYTGATAGLTAAETIHRNYFGASTEERQRVNVLGGRVRSAVFAVKGMHKWAHSETARRMVRACLTQGKAGVR